MSSQDQFAKIFAGNVENVQNLNAQFETPQGGGIISRFEFWKSILTLQDSGLRFYTRDISGSFILGHTAYGILGTSTLGSGASYGWTEKAIGGLQI